jgi:NADPH:quinone reductase-like Zn-dependent oxidoreductase
MKAIVQHTYGPPEVLELRDIDKPVVKDNEVLIRVHAAAVNAADWHLMRGLPLIGRMAFGLRKPKIKVRGRDVSGTVEAIGKNVTQFQPGDEVYAEVDTGSFADYTCVSEEVLGLKPANLTFEQAAAVPVSATTALQGLRDQGRIQAGQKVLINGASGGVGTFAVQIAKSFGAEVTGVCSARKADLVRSIGADHVVDYTQGDFTKSGQRYDLILDLVGNHSLSDCRRALTPNGTLVLSSGNGGRWLGPMGRIIKAVVLSPFVSQRLGTFVSKGSKENLAALKELTESGKLMPAIDRTYPLSEAPDAIRYLEGGHARGKVVITI